MLINDVVMPEMNGWDMANQLHPLCPNLKRLFRSGYTAHAIAGHGVLDEGIPVLQKPFSRKEMAAKIREAPDMEMK